MGGGSGLGERDHLRVEVAAGLRYPPRVISGGPDVRGGVVARAYRACDSQRVREDSAKRYSIASLAAPSVPIAAFTETAREAVVLAQAEAHGLDQDYLGTEHLLLGLLGVEEGLAHRVLRSFDVTAEVVRVRVLAMGAPGRPTSAAKDITVAPRSRKVLKHALREAIVLGFSAAGTEHMLLALIREHECVAAGILRALVPDADPEIRNAVIRTLSDTQPHMLRTQAVPFQATPRTVP